MNTFTAAMLLLLSLVPLAEFGVEARGMKRRHLNSVARNTSKSSSKAGKEVEIDFKPEDLASNLVEDGEIMSFSMPYTTFDESPKTSSADKPTSKGPKKSKIGNTEKSEDNAKSKGGEKLTKGSEKSKGANKKPKGADKSNHKSKIGNKEKSEDNAKSKGGEKLTKGSEKSKGADKKPKGADKSNHIRKSHKAGDFTNVVRSSVPNKSEERQPAEASAQVAGANAQSSAAADGIKGAFGVAISFTVVVITFVFV
eukprot:CAMPEP_0183743092 /NCGR_PEP_ID=MMETSP0737-20130205/65039_1 /TAXON_ID=385413 /ORGANISM="Thalassiosira miniscula, Strain CCMP1093" /LENGTH=253 /DNA_ID=CAMNT_0025978697 /DNA_START=1 /DNA_END=762 /DNA_ORIENTATION=+